MVVKGLDIFLTWDQYKELVTEDVREKLYKLPHIKPENIDEVLVKKNKILLDALEAKFSSDEKAVEFVTTWLKFDLLGEKAKENTWNLLRDYCQENSFASLKDNRSLENILKADYLGDSYTYYPMSKEFSLIYQIPEIKNFFGKKISPSTEIEIRFDTEKVTRIKGEFKSSFTIYTNEFEYNFGRGLSILPFNK